MLNPILIAVPIFLLSIVVEYYIGQKRNEQLYRWNDTLTNLHLGTGQMLCGLLVKAPLLAFYVSLWQYTQSWHIMKWDSHSPLHWLIGVLCMDCAYYFFHRYSHEFNFLWAAHVVHHQSEEYNLSVALRQSWLQQCYSGIFYLPMALLGIPIHMFFLLNATNTLYQFWIHTRLCGKLGKWEWWLNTPSHHRVHHGVDDEYVDKNYAGMLIIWDKMFGTFQVEQQEPRYGVIKPLRTWNTLWANMDVWFLMWNRMKTHSLTWWEKFSLAFRAPAWTGKQEQLSTRVMRTDPSYQLYDQNNPWLKYTVISGGLAVQSAIWWVIAQGGQHTATYLMPWIFIHLLSGISLAGVLESKRWGLWVEGSRLIVLPLIAYLYPLYSSPHVSSTLGGGISMEVMIYMIVSGISLSYIRYRMKTLNLFLRF